MVTGLQTETKTVGCVSVPFQKHRCYAPWITPPQSESFHIRGVGHPTEQPVVSTKPAAYPHLQTQPLNRCTAVGEVRLHMKRIALDLE